MVKLYSVAEMKALEKEANERGLSYEMMMENAGKGIAKEIETSYSHLLNKKIIALIGTGNNGGDALVALSYLEEENWETCAYVIRERDQDDPLMKRLIENGGKVITYDRKSTDLSELLESYSVLIDGVLGTGITLPLRGETAKALSFVKQFQETNSNKLHVVAVDCPSGIDCDTGEAAPEAISAEMTVTMAGIKTGLIRFPAARLAGEIRVAGIGPIEDFDAYTTNEKTVLTPELIAQYLPARAIDSHKGTFGTAFIIAGSVNYTGAALLAGQAAYRVGAGLVTMAIPAPLHQALSGQFPESTWVLLPHEIGVISSDAAPIVHQNLDRATAILVGPGFGLEETTKEFLVKLFSESREYKTGYIGFIHSVNINHESKNVQTPAIVDADGLKLIAKINDWPNLLPKYTVLTPHPGEMAILTGLSTEEIQANRIEIASKYSAAWGHIVVLKGAFTVIADPDGRIAVVPIASSALARAGTGDVLAGAIVGFRAQGLGAFQAACAGAWVHANAGLLAAKRLGNTASVIASDVLNAIPQIISELS